MPLTTIFFDAGNTLVFPELERTLAPLIAREIQPTTEQLHASERAAKKKLDTTVMASTGAGGTDFQYWHEYYSHLLTQLHVSDSELCGALVSASRVSANWSRLMPGTHEALKRLTKKFCLGIISNADGRIEYLLRGLGIGDFFQSFTDSGIVGHEKPHPAIFQAAIKSMGAIAAESIYVGDIYSVDYLGARAVGMDAMLLDASGTYAHQYLPRVESLAEFAKKFSD